MPWPWKLAILAAAVAAGMLLVACVDPEYASAARAFLRNLARQLF